MDHHSLTTESIIWQDTHPLLDGWKPFATPTSERTILDCFAEIVTHAPRWPAVVDGQNTITYAELNARANQVANGLLTQLGPGAEPVGHLFALGIDAFVALLGIAKAGKFYMALDSHWSDEQLQAALALSEARLILTDDPTRIGEQSSASVATTVCTINHFATQPPTDPEVMVHPHDNLYVVFTSGSTGVPKGALQTHRAMVHSARHGIKLANYRIGDRIGLTTSCTTTRGAIVTFYGLLSGAALVLFDQKQKTLEEFAAWLHAECITVISLVPTLFRHWIASLQPGETYPHLRLLKLSGETCLQRDFALFQCHLRPDAVLSNTYGTTETLLITEHCLNQDYQVADAVIPVGYPILEQTVYIVDEAGAPLPVGEPGEIAVCSAYLSPGYWRNPTLTAAKFLPGPEGSMGRIYLTGDWGRLRVDGMLEHLGRKDGMVKIRGYQVEPAAVEAVLSAIPTLKAVAVAVQTSAENEPQLVAYCVPEATPPTVSELRKTLQATLPAHMIPTAFVMLDVLPMLPNGKVDRKALPVPNADIRRERPMLDTRYQPPRTPLEEALVAIWEKLLQVERVGLYDNFFQLGGHSLLATQLLAQVEHTSGRKLPLNAFFYMPTIAHLAQLFTAEATVSMPEPDLRGANLSGTQQAAVQQLVKELADPAQPQTWRAVIGDQGWHRRRQAIHHALSFPPYALTRWTLTRFLHLPWLGMRCFQKEVALTQRFLAEIDHGHKDVADVIVECLLFNSLHYYHIVPKGRAVPDLVGREILNAARGRGIMFVAMHDTLFGKFKEGLLAEALLIGGIQNYLAHYQIQAEALEQTLFAQQLHTAQRVLQTGGAVKILPDGHRGHRDGIEVDFHGRRRPFRSSFAELALMTDATMIAVVGEVAPTGKIQVRLLGPLDAGDERLPHAERVERLVMEYVALLHQMWAETPWLVPWYQMERHLAYPPSIKA